MSEQNLSLGGNLWKIKNADERSAELLAQRFDIPLIVAKLLVQRGINADTADSFLNPKLQNLMPDPYVLKDMEKAAKRIADAAQNSEKVGIIGDYDVDGATSSALLGLFLESVGVQSTTHIPERDEGYGPSDAAFAEFAAEGIKLVITTDCGTTAFDVLNKAAGEGFEIIVIDHHEAEAKLPDVEAVVNPKRLDDEGKCPYLRFMAAVGVVFLTVVAVNRELRNRGFYNTRPMPDLKNWLDLVALGTVCDVVPLAGLNRAFVRQGLRVLAQRKNHGLKMLTDKAGISNFPTSYNLGFSLGPRINACGRVGQASLGNRLLKAKDDVQASLIADKMNEFNEARKQIEAYVLLQAVEILESTPQEYPIAFVYGRDWHQGVIGIVAGKLKERYNLPAFVMSIEEDEVKGSARSISGVDLGALIIAAKEKGLITKGGGHIMAAGFSLEEDKIEEFRSFVGQEVKRQLDGQQILPTLEIDAELELGGANADLAEKIAMLEPFGAANEEPLLEIVNIQLSSPMIIGSGHVRCFLRSDNGKSLKAIAFKVADSELGKALLTGAGDRFNVVGYLRVDNWQNQNLVQFVIVDAKRL